MVKGVSRQVVVVRSLDTKLFEQAIFLIRDGAIPRQGVTEADILREANDAANAYLQERLARRRELPYRFLWALAGAFATGAVWLLTVLLM